jgi:hypothetical protein
MGMAREDHPAFGGTYPSPRRRELLTEIGEVIRAELLAAGVISRDPGAPVPATHDPSPVKLAHWRVLHRSNKIRYRVGGKLGRSLYAQIGNRPDNGDLFLAMFDYAEVAHAFARVLNEAASDAIKAAFLAEVNAGSPEIRAAAAKYSASVAGRAVNEPIVAACSVDESVGAERERWRSLAEDPLFEESSAELLSLVRELAAELVARTGPVGVDPAETALPDEPCPPSGVYRDRDVPYRLWSFRGQASSTGQEALWYPHDMIPPTGGRLWPMTWPKAYAAGADPGRPVLMFRTEGDHH